MIASMWWREFRYRTEDARMRGIFVGSAGMREEAAIVSQFCCSRGDAWRVVEFRRVACLELQTAFLEASGRITWRRVWRIASTWPFEPELQAAALAPCLAHARARARAEKRRTRRSPVKLLE
jgi:hypothetical protein